MLIKLSQLLEDLREDHRNLALLLDLLEAESEHVDGDDEPDFELLHDIMQYMTVYSDAVHHPREDLVYEAMREHSAELAADLESIGPDHREIAELGSTLRSDIEAVISGTAVTRDRLLSDLQGYVARLRQHIAWEEDDLFPRADSMARENGSASIDMALFKDADPLFGATTAASFSNLLSHLQEHE
ncbi:MAG: hemerythrin domain-containing protein [Woeseiaceae bacterium]|nr:hemerythrin domain-containing protein [Woeseiaceae bacterium]